MTVAQAVGQAANASDGETADGATMSSPPALQAHLLAEIGSSSDGDNVLLFCVTIALPLGVLGCWCSRRYQRRKPALANFDSQASTTRLETRQAPALELGVMGDGALTAVK